MSNKQLKLSGIRILIIDADVVFAKRMETYFCRLGASVTLIHDGYQVVSACDWANPDIIFVDFDASDDASEKLLAYLSEGPWACIAMSLKSDLKLIRSALQLGAVDFLIKAGCEFDQIADIILSSIRKLPQLKEDYQRAELQEHFSFLKENDLAASQLFMRMLPESGMQLGNYLYIYQLKGSSLLPLVANLDETHCAIVVIDFGLLTSEMSIAAVILHSLLQDAWRVYQQYGELLAIQPAKLMDQINTILLSSQLSEPIGMFYCVVNHQQVQAVNAGIIDLPEPFHQADMGLGVFHGATYRVKHQEAHPQGLYFSLANQLGDRLSFKLCPLNEPVL
ncbi:response regulator [Celerinatantimonas sp. MCCC 1A17872]|uniref:response regulator n=1 Tax=Celerinatantimonas sp. MCCC 1A17872 TaxID=3177514 RepID=UPI0038C96998